MNNILDPKASLLRNMRAEVNDLLAEYYEAKYEGYVDLCIDLKTGPNNKIMINLYGVKISSNDKALTEAEHCFRFEIKQGKGCKFLRHN